jgi:small subunit ribosomal protein S20
MANTKSAIKNHRKTITRTLHNRSRKSRIKTLAKKVQELAADGSDKEALKSAAIDFMSAMDKAAKTNLIHVNKASRAKESVSKYILG